MKTPSKVQFYKYQGAGNDFIVIDNRGSLYSPFDASQIRYLCDRQRGIGADGILFIEMSKIADYRMRIFNADASEPAMCGNGLRCVFDFLTKENDVQELHIEVASRILSCYRKEEKIHVNLGVPSRSHWPIELGLHMGPIYTKNLKNRECVTTTTPKIDSSGCLYIQAYVLDTGVPHAVLFVEDILELPFSSLGEKIRWHRAFKPGGVNVNCATVALDGSIQLRTYERGVEKETLACGTGAAAAAWVAAHLYGLKEPVVVKTRMKIGSNAFAESMQFAFPLDSNGEKQIEMMGTAHCVFTGLIEF